MKLTALPDLCLDLVADALCECDGSEYSVWSRIDAARSVVALAAASKAMRTALAFRVAAKLEARPNDYERLVTDWKGRRPATVAALKEACEKNMIGKSGTATELRDRLRASLDRTASIGLSPKFVAGLLTSFEIRRYDAIHEALMPLGLSPSMIGIEATPGGLNIRKISRSEVMRRVTRLHGDPDVLWERKRCADAEIAAAKAARRSELIAALAARNGCMLRQDSQLCYKYIEGSGVLSLEQVVDETEAIRFFYNQTQYSSILRSSRRRYYNGSDDDDDYDVYFYVNEGTLRDNAKSEALRRWLMIPGNSRDRLPALIARTFV